MTKEYEYEYHCIGYIYNLVFLNTCFLLSIGRDNEACGDLLAISDLAPSLLNTTAGICSVEMSARGSKIMCTMQLLYIPLS